MSDSEENPPNQTGKRTTNGSNSTPSRSNEVLPQGERDVSDHEDCRRFVNPDFEDQIEEPSTSGLSEDPTWPLDALNASENEEDAGGSSDNPASQMKKLLKPKKDPEFEMLRYKGRLDIHAQCSDHHMPEPEEADSPPLSSETLPRPTRHGNPYEKFGLVGLRNIGNTCFMNSVLQCLSNTKPLLNYTLLSKTYMEEINTSTSTMRGNLIKAFGKLIQDLWSEAQPHDADTSSLKGQIQKFAPVFRGARQHDSQELLRFLLEGLHGDVNKVAVKPKLPPLELDDQLDDATKSQLSWLHYQKFDNSQVADIFVGQLKSTLKCLTCGYRSVTFDPFWDLSIPIPTLKAAQTAVKLEECLKVFTQEETLDGDEKPYCVACKTHRKCIKRFSIEKFPDVLVIHLKRFTTDDRGKLRTAVKFPMCGFDVGAYAETPISSCSYNLYGISNHYGTAFSGHYIGYCKHPFSHEWHCYDDSRVSKVTSEHVSNVEGYVLFYEMSEASKCVLRKK